MKIGIFGGSFNPPHKFHEKIAHYLIENNYLNKIIFVPTGSKYQYKNNLLPDETRLDMINLMIKDVPFMSSDDFELKDHPVYTWETLNYFREKYPQDQIYFICGTDNLTYIDKWENGLMLLRDYKFIVLKRNTDDIKEILKRFHEYKDNFVIVDLEESDLSSTYIRENITDETVRMYLNGDVYDYIRKHDLYK